MHFNPRVTSHLAVISSLWSRSIMVFHVAAHYHNNICFTSTEFYPSRETSYFCQSCGTLRTADNQNSAAKEHHIRELYYLKNTKKTLADLVKRLVWTSSIEGWWVAGFRRHMLRGFHKTASACNCIFLPAPV